ncbi:MAG: ParA family protein [Saprospiraceae bacterium]
MIIAITNLKGGSGKTTISVNLAVTLTQRGKSVCILDTDVQQRSSMKWAGDRDASLAHISVYGVEENQIIKEAAKLNKEYDIVILDGSPQLADLADSTMLASDIVIIPIKPSILDFRSTEEFILRYRRIKSLKESQGFRSNAYFVINDVKSMHTLTYKDTKGAVEAFEEPLLYSFPNLVAFQDSLPFGMGVGEYSDARAQEVFNEFTDKVEALL